MTPPSIGLIAVWEACCFRTYVVGQTNPTAEKDPILVRLETSKPLDLGVWLILHLQAILAIPTHVILA